MFHTKRLQVLGLMLVLTLFVGACEPIQVTTPTQQATEIAQSPSRVLFLGDSFSSFLFEHFPQLVASINPSPDAEIEVVWHPSAPLSLYASMPSSLENIQSGDWDVVALQEDIAENWFRVDQFPENVRKLNEVIQQSGAETVLYMHWPWKRQAEPSFEQIADTYGDVGMELGIKVAPVGLAWQRALQERPDLDLYNGDGIHPNQNGAYLAMSVLYATIFDQSPVGATYRMADSEGSYGWIIPEDWQLSDEDAEFLQRIAWETVAEYQAQR